MRRELITTFFALLLASIVTKLAAVEINGINYTLSSSAKAATVIAGNYSGKIVIPATVVYNNITYNVTTINAAFKECTGVTSVTIPNSVTSIGGNAFMNCTGLTSLVLGTGITTIEASAFEGCTGLTSVHIKDIAAWLQIQFKSFYGGTYANPLYYAKHLYLNGVEVSNLIIPDSIKYIKSYAFYNCSSLASVVFPDGVMSIGQSAFNGCTGLTTIIIPSSSAFTVNEKAFENCTSLSAVHIKDVAAWCMSSFSSNPLYYAKHLYLNGVEVSNLTIPEGVAAIKSSAFYNCSSLRSVIIPNSVTSIGSSSFRNCTDLTSVILGEGIKTIGTNAFRDCSSLTNITLGDSITDIEWLAFENCSSLSSITIGKAVTSLGDGIFKGCDSLSSIIWNARKYPEFTSIKKTPFYYEDGSSTYNFDIRPQIKSFIIGDEVETIPNYLCTDMINLDSLSVGKNVTSIGEYTFMGCSSLKSVDWNAKEYQNCQYSYGVKTPFCNEQKGALYNFNLDSQITSFVFGEDVQSIPRYLCYEMTNLTSITIPSSVKSIGTQAFHGCTGLTGKLVIPNSVTSIGGNAFSGCAGLTAVTIGDGVTSIGIEAFKDCAGIKGELVIPNSVTSIGHSAFYDCTSLDSVTLGNSITCINTSTFQYCTNLSHLTIGKNINDIHITALKGCTSLSSIVWNAKSFPDCSDEKGTPFNGIYQYVGTNQRDTIDLRLQIKTFVFGDDVDTIPNYLCYKMNKLDSISIGKNVTSIGKYTFTGCTSLKSVVWNAKNYPDCSEMLTPFFYSYTTTDGSTRVSFDLRPQITSFSFGNNVGSIPSYLCSKMIGISGELIIPNNVINIGQSAFNGCSSISGEMIIPNSVTTIGQSAFRDCSNITGELTIPNSVTSIGERVFSGCSGLTSVTIPNSVTSIGSYAFSGCTGLTSVTIPDSVTSIGSYAFSGCSNLTSVTIGNSLTTVGMWAFLDCNALTAVHINNIAAWCGVTFGYYSWEANPLYYAHHLYLNDEIIEDLIIPEGVTEIKELAFLKCSDLTSISIPSSVTNIEYGAFAYCTSDNTSTWVVNYSPTPQKIVEGVFNGLNLINPPTLYVPKNSIADYKAADVWKYFNVEALIDSAALAEMISGATTYYNMIKDDYPEISESLFFAIQAAQNTISNTNATLAQLTHANSELVTAIQTAEQEVATSLLAANKATFENYKSFANDSCANLAEDGDGEECLQLIADAQATIATLIYDENKSLEENEAVVDAIIEQLISDLTIQRAKEILDAFKVDFEAYKNEKSNVCADLAEEGDGEACLQLIADAQAAIAVLTYDENKSLEENKAVVDAVVEKLQNDLQNQREKDRSEDIEQINQSTFNCLKFLHNGQILILRGDKTYTITGAEVK